MNHKILTLSHGGAAGDVLLALPTIHWLLRHRQRQQAHLWLRTDNDHWTPTTAESLATLLRTQPCFSEITVGKPTDTVDLPMDVFRRTGLPLQNGDLAWCYSLAFPASPSLHEPWLQVQSQPNDLILVNKTPRYPGQLHFRNLQRYKARVRFVGHVLEHKQFCLDHLDVPHLVTETYLELAQAIQGCRLFVGNQSSAWVIADALKVPRILEIPTMSANVMPHGPGGWVAWRQDVFDQVLQIILGE